jgi:hypothetical protein
MSSQNNHTTAPLAFSAVYRVNPGAQQELSELVTEYVDAVQAAGPGTLGLSTGLSDDGERFAVAALHANTGAMEDHLVAIAPFIERSFRLAAVETISVVGTPGPRLTTALEANGAAGASVTVIEQAHGFAGAGATAR